MDKNIFWRLGTVSFAVRMENVVYEAIKWEKAFGSWPWLTDLLDGPQGALSKYVNLFSWLNLSIIGDANSKELKRHLNNLKVVICRGYFRS